MIASVLVSLTVTALSKVALCRWYIESHVEAAVTEDVSLIAVPAKIPKSFTAFCRKT